MPLIVMTGIPSSGKSFRAKQLKEALTGSFNKVVHIVSENEFVTASSEHKSNIYLDSSKEKEIRASLKTKAQRLIGRDDVVILDASNYIKGYRYELYCMSKASKTTQCTVYCNLPIESARQWNSARSDGGEYSPEVFEALTLRYEAPDSRNRWDSPLFTVLPDSDIPAREIYEALFERKAPPPNQSTQCAPLSSTNFLYELDRVTQAVVTAVKSAQLLGLEGDVPIPECGGCVLTIPSSNLTTPQLNRLRRQFLAYNKLHPGNDASKIGPLFVQFLNTSLADHGS